MPFKDPEKRKQYLKKYREENKDFIKKLNKEWRENNKEYIYEKNKKYANGEGKHIEMCSKWRSRGIKLKPNEDWDSVYLFYITCEKCEECGVDLKNVKRCLDHDHETGFIRDVLCNRCNVIRG
jgi:hypothetical protein